MANSETFLRKLFGPARVDIRPLILAVDVTAKLLFDQGYNMDSLLVTKHVYPEVAKLMGRKSTAVAKSVERLTRLCWDILEERELTEQYIGKHLYECPTSRELLIYLAVYMRLGNNFIEVAEIWTGIYYHTPTGVDFGALGLFNKENANYEDTEYPLLLVFTLGGEYKIVPVCRACMYAIEQHRHDVCGNCKKCRAYEKSSLRVYPAYS